MSANSFDSLVDYQAQIQQLISNAERTLCWFDADLSSSGIDKPELVASIRHFLAASNLARVKILLQEDVWFWRKCTHLNEALGAFGHAVEVRICNEVDKVPGEQFLISEAAAVRRFYPTSMRGEASSSGTVRTLCQQRFDDLWSRAELPSEGRRLFI
ncbi:DUF7931 domain-containing protein [Chitinimonas sp. BJB300]|uniref:DUF7931 domain-containing protein n=1 Tax=Chitinimonas sp. BJB300 TaxID=1559339 RepID=UPI00111232B4|nr:hypothetical protein [Chitinimonas sp. BJB300]TSJ87370.1 hypothetical protein FG002_014130 [Chitinimonas sp. BJB300]